MDFADNRGARPAVRAKIDVTIDPRKHEAVLFNLDGVVANTALLHEAAWRTTFDEFFAIRRTFMHEDHSPFTMSDYRRYMHGIPRCAGIKDFLAARDIVLSDNEDARGAEETVQVLADRAQRLFSERIPGEVQVFEPAIELLRKLADEGIATALFSSSYNCEEVLVAAGIENLFAVRVDGVVAETLGLPGNPHPAVLLEAAARLGVRPERSVVLDDSEAGVQAARGGDFGLVVGVDRGGRGDRLLHYGADVGVSTLSEIAVRTGDRRISQLPGASDAFGHLGGIVDGRQPFVCLDYDGILSDIVADPDVATLVGGVAAVLQALAQQCPVAILSGGDPADIRSRLGLSELWYSGAYGYELIGPDGAAFHHDAAELALPRLAPAAAKLRGDVQDVPGVHVEIWPYAVAVDYRNVARQRLPEVFAVAHRCADHHGLRVTPGRRVLEFRPDIDWHSGKAMTWIRDRVCSDGGVLPIYIGADLAEEDAFDCVRYNGIGMVMRKDEDGDRPTAAQFACRNIGEVCEFLQRLTDILVRRRSQISDDTWTFTFEGYDPRTEKQREALCTIGNGHFATRGAAPEASPDHIHYPGTYAAGVYNRLDDVIGGAAQQHESLVNLPNWLPLTFRINEGDWFNIDEARLLTYRQTLDMRDGVLTREFRFADAAGHVSSVTQHRFAAMQRPNVAALSMTIVAENWSGTIDIRSTLDANVCNCGVERYLALNCHHLEALTKMGLNENSVCLGVRTTQSQISIAMAARTIVQQNNTGAGAKYRLVDEEFEIGHEMFVELETGQSVTVEKVVTMVTDRDVAISTPADAAARQLAWQGQFAEIRDAHVLAWTHIWERLDIDLRGQAEELRILRLHSLHLMQTVSHHSADLDSGVPARGLHGEAYRGHIFWDELFIFPVLNLRFPAITRALLRYRYRRLAEARRAAKDAGYAGAMFPWQSGSDGREESPSRHLNPRSGRWNPDASHLAHHIGVAVAYNVWQFYQVTGDLAYLIDYGAELLVEIARFWVSRTTYDTDSDRYGISGVIGPDEFHTGYADRPFEGIDNNAYTNVMAVWVILRALDALNELPLPNRLDLWEKLRLSEAELATWDRVSRRMTVPFHGGMLSQFEGYDELAELDWDSYRARYGDIQRLDRILEAEGDDVTRYKASKQADALMLLFLLSSDELRELLDRLGYHLASETIPTMVDYYLARTSHGSTLSAVVHSWVLARANRDRAMEFFKNVLKSDVDDIQGGTTSEGIHLAAMAGSIDLVQRCFTGLETRGNRIVLDPHWPESSGPLGFPIHYRGHLLYLQVCGRGAEVSAAPRDVPPVVVECAGRVQRLSAGQVIKFPDESVVGTDELHADHPPGQS